MARRTVADLALVRPGAGGWAEAFGLALANWGYDAVCLVACLEALRVPVPWRAVGPERIMRPEPCKGCSEGANDR